MPKRNLDFFLVNWNIGGAKYLELPSDPSWDKPENDQQPTAGTPKCREDFQSRLQDALKILINVIGNRPHVITMQEVVRYEENGDFENAKDLFSKKFLDKLGYKYHFFPLIDTRKHSAEAKWNKLIDKPNSGWDKKAYFAQGNAILVRDDIALFPVWGIPKLGVKLEQYKTEKKLRLRALIFQTTDVVMESLLCSTP